MDNQVQSQACRVDQIELGVRANDNILKDAHKQKHRFKKDSLIIWLG